MKPALSSSSVTELGMLEGFVLTMDAAPIGRVIQVGDFLFEKVAVDKWVKKDTVLTHRLSDFGVNARGRLCCGELRVISVVEHMGYTGFVTTSEGRHE